MGKYHQSKKAHSKERGRKSSNSRGESSNSGRRSKLPEDFLYAAKHKNIWTAFCNFFDERLAAEDLGDILDENEVTRIKTAPTIPPMLQFIPANVGDVETEEQKNERKRGQQLADKSYASRESQYFDGINRLASRFGKASLLLLKYVDSTIHDDLWQFLKTDAIKALDPESKYNRLRQHFKETWGPHSSLDVTKIKEDLTTMQGDTPGWRKYLQNFNYSVAALEQTEKRDANNAIIRGPLPAAVYPPRPLAAAPAAQHTAYVAACQAADELRDAQNPLGGPALNYRPTDEELKTILLDALSVSKLRAYQGLYQQYCNRTYSGRGYQDLYNDIQDLVRYESDGIKSSLKDSDYEDSDASRSTTRSSQSSNSHSSRRNAQIAAAANFSAQQVAANTAANIVNNQLYQQSPGKQGSSPNGKAAKQPCKNCKSTQHGTKWCTSTKCFEPGCGKTFGTADERKAHFISSHGTLGTKPSPQQPKPAIKNGGKHPRVKFSKTNRVISLVNRVQRDLSKECQSDADSEVSSDSSMSVDHEPKSLVWKGNVSNLRTVSSIRRSEKACVMPLQDNEQSPADDQPPADEADDSDGEPPPLCEDDSDSSDEDEPPAAKTPIVTEAQDKEPPARLKRQPCRKSGSAPRIYLDEGNMKVKWHPPCESGSDLTNSEDDGPPGLAEDSSDEDDCINTDIPADAQPKARDERKPSRKSAPHLCYYPNGERKPDSEIGVGSDDDSDHGTPVKGPEPVTTAQKGILRTSQTRESNFSTIGEESYDILDRRIAYDPATGLAREDFMFELIIDRHSSLDVYIAYRKEGGRMKFFPEDDGTEYYYERCPKAQLTEGDWQCDYNYIAPCGWTARSDPYRWWYISVHPKPVDLCEARRNWFDRRQQLRRQQACKPGSFEAYLRDKHRNDPPSTDTRDPEIWDEGRIWRKHMIRKQAAFEVICATRDIYLMEQDIDNYLIYMDQLNVKEEEEEQIAQQYALQATTKRAQELAKKPMTTEQLVKAAVMMTHQGATRMQPVPTSTVHQERDWEFFFESLDGPVTEHCMDSLTEPLKAPKPTSPPAQRVATPPRTNPLPKLRTQSATTLSDRIRQTQTGMRKLVRKQRMVNAIVDTGAQVTTMPESAVNKMPTAHNHRDAPPGTAVKYGNGEIETIERLVDIGHYEVQVTPDNCQASLISVDQIVQDGHTVTFSATETIIADDKNRYSLSYPRVPDSREWTVPMHAMEEITKLRQSNPRDIQRN